MFTFRNSIILVLIIGSFYCASAKTGPTHGKVVVCYISTWAVYREKRGSYAIDNFDPNLCTHAVYAFAGLDSKTNAIKSLDPWQDLKDDYGKGGYERMTGLKKTYPHLKVTLAIGGWNEGSKNYSRMAADPVRRTQFVTSATAFIRKYNFDGLDLDWEYPTQREGEPMDRENFVHLVKELKESFKPYNLLLTSAFGAAKNTIDLAYDISILSKYLDYMHIMCYDYGGSWDKKITPNAPLHDTSVLNVQYTINYLIKLGASPSKIVMGIPFYGRSFITNLEGNYGDASNEFGFQGPYTKQDGFLGYNELCAMLGNKSLGWTSNYDTQTNQAIAKHHENSETKVVVYDSTRSIAVKAKFAMQKDLAGIMVWSIDTDDFLGDCDAELDTYEDFGTALGVKLTIPKRTNSNYPLMRTVNEAMIIALDEIEQENAIHDSDNEIPHTEEDDSHKGDSNCIYGSKILLLITMTLINIIQNTR